MENVIGKKSKLVPDILKLIYSDNEMRAVLLEMHRGIIGDGIVASIDCELRIEAVTDYDSLDTPLWSAKGFDIFELQTAKDWARVRMMAEKVEAALREIEAATAMERPGVPKTK